MNKKYKNYYYPFGMPMPNRQIVGGEQYRYPAPARLYRVVTRKTNLFY